MTFHVLFNVFYINRRYFYLHPEIQTDAGPPLPAAPPRDGVQPRGVHGSHDGDDVAASSGPSSATSPPSSPSPASSSFAAFGSASHLPSAMPRPSSAAPRERSPVTAPPPAPGLTSCPSPFRPSAGKTLTSSVLTSFHISALGHLQSILLLLFSAIASCTTDPAPTAAALPACSAGKRELQRCRRRGRRRRRRRQPSQEDSGA